MISGIGESGIKQPKALHIGRVRMSEGSSQFNTQRKKSPFLKNSDISHFSFTKKKTG
jgi:hypothetical protein